MEPLVVVLGIGLLIAFGVGSYVLAQKRRQELLTVASGLGLTYAREDPFGLLGLPFSLFRRGDGRGCENVMWGTHEGNEVQVFEYWYYEESTDAKGNTSRSYSRFSCAVLTLPIDCPETTIGPENLFTRLADAVGFRDIDFESEEFNRAMQVKSADRRFANYLIDARAMQWLLANRGWTYLLSGPYLLAVIHRLRPREVPQLLTALHGFRAIMPDVVFDAYGSR